MLDAVVFDIGKVLFAYDPVGIIRALLPETRHEDFFLEHLFFSPMWQDLDRGDCSEEEALEQLRKKTDDPDIQAGLACLLDRFVEHLIPIPGSVQLFSELADRYPLYLLTNFQDKPFEKLWQLHPFLHRSQGAVVSARVRQMKPSEEIYRQLFTRFNLNPSQSVFIDDLPENIAAAKSLGMKGIVFETPEQVACDLKDLGIRTSLCPI